MGTKKDDEAMDLMVDSPVVFAVQQMKAFEKLSKSKKVRIAPWISALSRSRLDVLCAFRKTTISALIEAAINDYIKKESYAIDKAISLFKELAKNDYEATP